MCLCIFKKRGIIIIMNHHYSNEINYSSLFNQRDYKAWQSKEKTMMEIGQACENVIIVESMKRKVECDQIIKDLQKKKQVLVKEWKGLDREDEFKPFMLFCIRRINCERRRYEDAITKYLEMIRAEFMENFALTFEKRIRGKEEQLKEQSEQIIIEKVQTEQILVHK